MHSYVILVTKMWDFIQYHPTLYPTIPPIKAVLPKKGTYIYIVNYYSKIPTVVKLGD